MRALIVLSHALHVRNWIASGLVQMLVGRGHTLMLLAPHRFLDALQAGIGEFGVFPIEFYLGGSGRHWLRSRLRTASFVRRERANRTYAHKLALRLTGARTREESSVRTWSRRLAAWAEIGSLRAAGRALDTERLARRVEMALPPPRRLVSLFSAFQPDVAIVPSTIQDGAEPDVVKVARAGNIPSVVQVATWDCLVSKGAFLALPDWLLVWGEQSTAHAVAEHGFSPSRVIATGPPQWDVYAEAPDPNLATALARYDGMHCRRPNGHPWALVAGSTIAYWRDEWAFLQSLSGEITAGRLPVNIWYRPHPRRMALGLWRRAVALPGVTVDFQAIQAARSGGFAPSGTDLLHFRWLLDSVACVVTAMGTLAIEGLVRGRPALLCAFGAGVIDFAQWQHLDPVPTWPGVRLCRTPEEVFGAIRDVLAHPPDRAPIQAAVEHAARCLDGGARGRICIALERIAREIRDDGNDDALGA